MLERYTVSALPWPCRTADDVRLTAQNSSTLVLSEGQVEVFYNGIWGGICYDGWDLNDAKVVCRQLGFPDAVKAVNDTWAMGNMTSRPQLTNVQCNGSEEHLRGECAFSKMEENQNCTHGEATVVCQGTLFFITLVLITVEKHCYCTWQERLFDLLNCWTSLDVRCFTQ